MDFCPVSTYLHILSFSGPSQQSYNHPSWRSKEREAGGRKLTNKGEAGRKVDVRMPRLSFPDSQPVDYPRNPGITSIYSPSPEEHLEEHIEITNLTPPQRPDQEVRQSRCQKPKRLTIIRLANHWAKVNASGCLEARPCIALLSGTVKQKQKKGDIKGQR